MKNKALYILLGVSTTLFVVDLVSTFINGDVVEYLESNLLYLFTGSFIPIYILNFLVFGGFWYVYTHSKPFWRYTSIALLTWFNIIRGQVIWNNLQVYKNPPTIAEAAAVTVAEKVSYSWLILLAYAFPFIISLIIYGLLILDHKVIKKE